MSNIYRILASYNQIPIQVSCLCEEAGKRSGLVEYTGYNGVGGVFCIFAQFSVGYACRGEGKGRVAGGLLNIGTLTLPVVYTIYCCAVVPVPDCFTYKDTNYATRHLTFHCPKSLGRTLREYKELFDEKDIRL